MIDPREFGNLEAKVDHIEKTLVANTAKLDEIHAHVLKQKGAANAIVMLATAISAIVGWLVSYFSK